MRGIRYGEYRCEKDDDLAMLAAQQYYVEQGSGGEPVSVPKLTALLPRALPEQLLAGGAAHVDKWVQMVLHSARKAGLTEAAGAQQTAVAIKEEVAAYAKYKWPLLFSRFYEAYKYAGPPLPRNEVIIAVNWTGLYVVDDQEQVLLELSFPEITTVTYNK